MDKYDPTETRLQLWRNGYTPIPGADKRCWFKGYNTQAHVDSLSEDVIRGWEKERRNYKTTNIQVRDGLMPIDFDISDEEVSDLMLERLYAIAPAVYDGPWRTGNRPKIMLFARWVPSDKHREMFFRNAVKFTDLAGKSQMIEVFGGKLTAQQHASKQVGVFGPHSYNEEKEDGFPVFSSKPKRLYAWEDATLADPGYGLQDLPAMTEGQVWELLAAFDEIGKARGWKLDLGVEHAGTKTTFNYTIDEATTQFEPLNDPTISLSYADLEEGMRVSGSFIDGSSNRTKCIVGYCRKHDDETGVFDYESRAWHLPKRLQPADSNEALAERLRALPDTAPAGPLRPTRPRASAPLEAKAQWLLATQAYSPIDFTVIDLFEPSDRCQMAPKAFQMLYRPWRDVGNYGPEGGKVTLTATGAWEVSTDRTDVAGVRMRPDMPFPLYAEAGARYKNTYLKPAHPAGGDLAPFLAFLDRFLPDPTEREWLLDWMAHKQHRPEIPGTAVVFVADDEEDVDNGKFGTGRGMLFRVAAKLFGAQYTRAQSFGIVSGTSSQGTYNDWIQGSVLVMVDEAKTPTGHRRAERSSVYEVLKDTVDPAPKRMRVNPKGRQAYDSVSFCSFWIATNHRNAMAIPRDDRRFTVLRNGRPMTAEERSVMEAWLGDDANIGALAASLAARDLAGFDMFVPLDTVGKADMAELALSEVDHVMDELANDAARGLVFTREQMELEVERHLGARGNRWMGPFEAAWPERCAALKTPNGGPRRIRTRGTQRKLYCFRSNLGRVKRLPEAAVVRECSKWGGETAIPGLTEVIGSHQKDE